MSASTSTSSHKGLVLVSGANGFVAMWIVKSLLEQGYAVRGTVRSKVKGEYMKKMFEAHGANLEIAVVEDITKNGAFDQAVQGVDYIEHTASPVHLNADHPDEMIVPAVQGTLSMLQSAFLKSGSQLKRVVITSSCGAILHQTPTPTTFSETDWNDQAVKRAIEKGRDADALSKYRASKTLAERAAWEFYEKHRKEEDISWRLVIIHPPWVFGPVLHEVSSASSLNPSNQEWYNTVLTPNSNIDSKDDRHGKMMTGGEYIDVRDAAEAHVRALHVPLVGDEEERMRIIVSAGPYIWQQWVNVVNQLKANAMADLLKKKDLPDYVRLNVEEVKRNHLVTYNNAKSLRVLGMEYRGMEETAKDMVEDFISRGW